MPVPRLSRDELKEVVLGAVDNRILLSTSVPNELIGLVFMPVALGALLPPDEALPIERPVPPVMGPIPDVPPDPVLPPRPVPRACPTEPPYPEEDLQKAAYGYLLEADVLRKYDSDMEAHRQAVREWDAYMLIEYEAALGNYRQAVYDIRRQHDAAVQDARRQAAAVQAEYRQALTRYEEEEARYLELQQAASAEWIADVGVLYAYLHEASPRSINGSPIFMGFRILHREDWDIVRPAIDREINRRRDADVLEGL